jgi:hypothetical protein
MKPLPNPVGKFPNCQEVSPLENPQGLLPVQRDTFFKTFRAFSQK